MKRANSTSPNIGFTKACMERNKFYLRSTAFVKPSSLGAILWSVTSILMEFNKIIFISTVAFVSMLEHDINGGALSTQKFHRVLVQPNKNIKSIIPSKDSVEIIVRIGNIDKDTASTSLVIANKGLSIILNGYPKDFYVSIIQFNITVIDRYMDTIATNVRAKGNMFTIEQIDQLKKLNGKGKVIFHNIDAVGGSSRVRRFPPFSIIIRG